jgi:hypothetical protein
MSEIRIVRCLILSFYKDELAEIHFCKALASGEVFSIKIPKSKTKFLNQLNKPLVILEIELVKTVKNWIFNEILSEDKILEPSTYKEFELLSKCNQILNKNCIDGDKEVGDLVEKIKQYFVQTLTPSLDGFENFLLVNLGFAGNRIDFKSNIAEAKDGNNLPWN